MNKIQNCLKFGTTLILNDFFSGLNFFHLMGAQNIQKILNCFWQCVFISGNSEQLLFFEIYFSLQLKKNMGGYNKCKESCRHIFSPFSYSYSPIFVQFQATWNYFFFIVLYIFVVNCKSIRNLWTFVLLL